MSLGLSKKRNLPLLVAALITLFIMAACGGPTEESGNGDEQSPQGSNQSSNSGGQNSSQNAFSSANPCDAFSMIGGLGGVGFMGGILGGPSVDTSDSPSSDFADDVAGFTQKALEEVFDGDVSSDCFIEVNTDEGGGVWIALTLPGAPPSGVADSVGAAMEDLGATVSGAFSANSVGGSFDLVSLETMPVDPPTGSISMGGLYFVTAEEGYYQAVMLATYDEENNQASQVDEEVMPSGTISDEISAATGGISIPDVPAGQPADEPAIVAVTPTGNAGTINDVVQPALEDALGVSLVVESFFQTSVGGNDTISLFYVVQDGEIDSAGAVAGFSGMVEDFGGTVGFSMAAGGGANITFEGASVADLTVGGNLAMSEANIILTITSAS